MLCGQSAWRPLYGSQLSGGQFAAVSCPCSVEVVISRYDDTIATVLTTVSRTDLGIYTIRCEVQLNAFFFAKIFREFL